MHYFSTNRKSPPVSFRDAVLVGQPDDKGLYFPSEIPRLASDLLKRLSSMSRESIAFEVIRPFVDDMTDETLFQICSETVNFDFPLVPLTERITALELFHGPTLAFKDVGARFMSRCLRYYSRDQEGKTVVLVATSGDTGGAVAAGFHGIEGIEVVIIYPKGKVSRVQELQLTTLGGNVTALELDGTFDDCQALAKRALADTDLQVRLTSANSINVARWLPQQIYYFYALAEWEGEPPIISVPSGNFGNLAAGILAHVSGLPVRKFIAACNTNDVVPRFMESADYRPRPSVPTLSNAMDVGSPSNFVRILEIFGNKFIDLQEKLEAVSVSDEATAATLRAVYRDHRYVLDPHGAVGFRALAEHLEQYPGTSGIFLETAHPVKFDSVNEILAEAVPIPPAVEELFAKKAAAIAIRNDYDSLKALLEAI
ncbi:MAG TPA: threonine synthase [Pyrinomonadaceae bacterium]|nr:threonine synthase [Pyrinomonadaceae bacterium]